ncbi:MAG: hypothetical protein AAF152_11235 [Cyanobacteria bacterium P01_A01_bin.114]
MKVHNLDILEDVQNPQNCIGGYLNPPPCCSSMLSFRAFRTTASDAAITDLDLPPEPGTLSIEGLMGQLKRLGEIRPAYRYSKTFTTNNGRTQVVSLAGSGQIGSSGVYSFASQSIRTVM